MPELRGKLKLLTESQKATIEAQADEFIRLNILLVAQERLLLGVKNQPVLKPKKEKIPRTVIAKSVKNDDDYLARIRAANNWSSEELEAKIQKARLAQND